MKKRVLSLLLSCAVVSTLLCAGASAAPASPFADVPADAWYAPYVEQAYEARLMNGLTGTSFAPGVPMTRAMFVTILGRLAGADSAAGAPAAFADVESGTWYAPYVTWAVDNGVTRGTDETHFSPDANVSREQMATFVGRYLEAKGLLLPKADAAVASFADGGLISDYAVVYADLMRVSGIFSGDQYGDFCPRDEASRAQAAKVFTVLKTALSSAAPYTVRTEKTFDSQGNVTSETVWNDSQGVSEKVSQTTYVSYYGLTNYMTLIYSRDGFLLQKEYCKSSTNIEYTLGTITLSSSGTVQSQSENICCTHSVVKQTGFALINLPGGNYETYSTLVCCGAYSTDTYLLYDTQGRVCQEIYVKYDTYGNEESSSKTVNTYNDDGSTVQEVWSFSGNTMVYTNDQKDAYGRPTQSERDEYSGDTPTRATQTVYTYYDDGSFISDVVTAYENGTYTIARHTYNTNGGCYHTEIGTFDADGNLIDYNEYNN